MIQTIAIIALSLALAFSLYKWRLNSDAFRGTLQLWTEMRDKGNRLTNAQYRRYERQLLKGYAAPHMFFSREVWRITMYPCCLFPESYPECYGDKPDQG